MSVPKEDEEEIAIEAIEMKKRSRLKEEIKSVEIVRRFTTKHARAILRVTMRSNEDPEEEFDATIELNDGSTSSMEYKARRSE